MCIREAIGTRKPLKFKFIHTVSWFRCFYALNFRQRPSIIEICRNQVHTDTPHTYSVSQPLPSYVYSWSNRHPKIVRIHVHTHGVDIWLLLCSQLPPKSFNHRDVPESSPHRYPTHTLSHNHWHHMCICVDVGTRQLLEFIIILVYFAAFMLSTCDKVL
jgi:hypothetical protein